MLLSYMYFKQLRTTFGSISMWFAVCGIGASVYPLMGDRPGDGTPLCIVQSLVGSYFVLVSLFSTNILVRSIFRLFYPLEERANDKTKLTVSWRSVAYAWGGPFLLVLIPLTTNSYGQDGDDM